MNELAASVGMARIALPAAEETVIVADFLETFLER